MNFGGIFLPEAIKGRPKKYHGVYFRWPSIYVNRQTGFLSKFSTILELYLLLVIRLFPEFYVLVTVPWHGSVDNRFRSSTHDPSRVSWMKESRIPVALLKKSASNRHSFSQIKQHYLQKINQNIFSYKRSSGKFEANFWVITP